MTGSAHSFDPKTSVRELEEEAAAAIETRKKVRIKHHSPEVKPGDRGAIVSKHTGTFYGVAVAGGIAFMPPQHVDPDNDNDVDTPGQPDVDVKP